MLRQRYYISVLRWFVFYVFPVPNNGSARKHFHGMLSVAKTGQERLKYRQEIDGLRALAVLPVILFHAGFSAFSGGFIGVDIFFVISGYLITSIILSEKEAGTFSFLGFYERRARRILPALFVVILLCLPFAWALLLPGDMKDFSGSVLAVSGFVSNVFFWQQSGYFDTQADLKPLLHTWSLAVEEQYYLFFPVVLLVVWRFGTRAIAAALAVAGLASLIVAQWASVRSPDMNFFLLPTRSWELLIGSLVAFILFYEKPKWVQSQSLAYAKEIGGALGLCLIAYAIFMFDENTPFPSLYGLLPTLGTALIILCADRGNLAGKILGNKAFVAIGLVSYSAYLWHQPIFAFSRHYFQATPSTTTLLALSLTALGLAYLTWRFVEQPFRNRDTISRKQIFSCSVAGTIALVLFGWAGMSTQGFATRYDARDRALVLTHDQRDNYVWARLYKHEAQSFDQSGKKKVLIIGDSYAGDLVNALYESGLNESIQISTHLISARCGNLYLEQDFSLLLNAKDRTYCKKENWYGGRTLSPLMKQADSIWLVSSWKLWQVKFLPESKRNLEKDYGNKITVFGRKEFGTIKPQMFLKLSDAERANLVNKLSSQHIKTTQLMRSTVQEDFFDVSELLCGSDDSCHPFTTDAKLISFDGGHLTTDGARFYAQRLLKDHQFRRLLGLDDEQAAQIESRLPGN